MSNLTRTAIVFTAMLIMAAVTAPLAGCAYDYTQRTDRVSFNAGNAVKGNLEAETSNPSKRSMYSTRNLGSNGSVVPVAPGGGAPTN